MIPRQRRAHVVVWLVGGPLLFAAALWLITQRPHTGAGLVAGRATEAAP